MKPAFIGSIVKAEAILLPALTAELVILPRAVAATTCNAENFAFIVSTPLLTFDTSKFLAAALTLSKPLAAPSSFKLFFSLSRVDMLVETFFSN